MTTPPGLDDQPHQGYMMTPADPSELIHPEDDEVTIEARLDPNWHAEGPEGAMHEGLSIEDRNIDGCLLIPRLLEIAHDVASRLVGSAQRLFLALLERVDHPDFPPIIVEIDCHEYPDQMLVIEKALVEIMKGLEPLVDPETRKAIMYYRLSRGGDK
jgi:hypothetical protein